MTALSLKHRYGLSSLTGVLLTISFPFSGSLTPLIFIAWIPLLLVENNLSEKSKSGRHVFVHAYWSFFIYNLGSNWWIWNSTSVGGILAFVFNSLLMALAFLLFHFLRKRSAPSYNFLLFPTVWVAFEFCHYNWELSHPWLTMGNIFSELPNWIQWYEFTGVLGGSLWILLINALLLRLFLKWKNTNEPKSVLPLAAGSITLLIIPIVISYLRLSSFEEDKTNKMHVLSVQPNIDPYNEKFSASYTPEDQLEKFYTMITPYKSKKIDLVMGPETMLSADIWEEYIDSFGVIKMMIREKKNWPQTEFLVGASTSNVFEEKVSSASKPLPKGNGYIENYNTSLFLNNFAKLNLIHKSKLVLGVEKIPFASWFPFLEDFALDNGGTSGSLGIEKEPKVIHSSKGILAPVICYESIYGEFVAEQCAKGAEAICIITNDGWWGDSPGYKQHFSFARLRAIENRRWVVRSANTGKSGFISPTGMIAQETGYWEPATIDQEITLSSELTFYTKYGDYIGIIALVLTVMAFISTLVGTFIRKIA